jgi:hypothetical protein
MRVTYKNPKVKYVRLDSIDNGTFFKIEGGTDLFLRLEKEPVGKIGVRCFNTRHNLIEVFMNSTMVYPYEDVEIVVHTTPR